MALDEWIAAVAGTAGAVQNEQRYQDQQEQRNQALQVREMLAALREAGLDRRAGQASLDRRYGVDMRYQTAEEALQQRASEQVDRLNHWGEQADIQRQTLTTNDATRRRGQDMQDAQFWGGTNALGWASDATRRAISNENNATARRGQDMSAATAQRGQDITAGTAQRGQDISAEVQQRGQDLTDDRGWGAIDERATSGLNPDAAVTRPPARPNITLPPRTAPQAAPQAAPAPQVPQSAAAPQGRSTATPARPSLQVGQWVQVKGKAARIKAVYPDGSFDIE